LAYLGNVESSNVAVYAPSFQDDGMDDDVAVVHCVQRVAQLVEVHYASDVVDDDDNDDATVA
jgi:hypothetical protein